MQPAEALEGGSGWAAGKLGVSERGFLEHPMIRATAEGSVGIRAFEQVLNFKGMHICGVFPADSSFLVRWCASYLDAVRELDWLGVCGNALPETARVLGYHAVDVPVVDQRDQQPDRSTPAHDERCWLPLLRGRRVLLVCPFASLLRDRATKALFEAVWAKTGKRWFDPADVQAIDFAYWIEPATHALYADALELGSEIAGRIDDCELDIAIVAAGGLGIPLAAHVKRSGRVGLSLGGHLQVMFGVHGERWLAMEHWRERYINDAWIRVPASYAPSLEARTPVLERMENEGYW